MERADEEMISWSVVSLWDRPSMLISMACSVLPLNRVCLTKC